MPACAVHADRCSHIPDRGEQISESGDVGSYGA